jgi:hypothetical protein
MKTKKSICGLQNSNLETCWASPLVFSLFGGVSAADVYNVYIANQFQTTFVQLGGGGRRVRRKGV